MAYRCTFLVVFPDKTQVYSASSEPAAVKHAQKSNGKVLHIFHNVETQSLEVRDVDIDAQEE